MFTVKHISISGDEVLYAAEDVACRQCREPSSTAVGEPWRSVVTIKHRDHPHRDLHNGTVFIMNEAGATVSRWDLGASQVPLGDDVTGSNSHHMAKVTSTPRYSVNPTRRE